MPVITRSDLKREEDEIARAIRLSKLDCKHEPSRIRTKLQGKRIQSVPRITKETVIRKMVRLRINVATNVHIWGKVDPVSQRIIYSQPDQSNVAKDLNVNVRIFGSSSSSSRKRLSPVPRSSQDAKWEQWLATAPEVNPFSDESREARIIRRNMPKAGSRAYKQRIRLHRDKQNDTVKRPSLKLTLPGVPYYKFSKGKLKKMRIRRITLGKESWPYEGHRFKLGHNAWTNLGLPSPTESQIREVHRLLMEHNRTFDFSAFVALPAHATARIVTVDNLIQTIFSQTTGNELAIDGHSRLCNAFPYLVHGKKYAGTVPNWHVIRTIPIEELERMLQPMGLQAVRARAVKTLLDVVYVRNLERRYQGSQQYNHELNDPDAKDFVPGLLSIEYLTEDDPSTEELLGRLLKLPKFGPKSAMCVAAFSYKRPLFVVDVHVARFCKWLGWIPAHAHEIEAACYLHALVPDDIKFDLHNQIWTHCAVENGRERHGRGVICYTCGSTPPAKDKKIRPCPLDKFLPPLDQRWKRKYQLIIDDATISAAIKIGRSASHDDTQIPNSSFVVAAAAESKEQSTEAAKAERPKQDSLSRKTKRMLPSSFRSPSEKKWPRTMPYGSVGHSEAAEAGYLLWEFRRMDNSFGEEWGTFDKLPRFKWERPDIMDAEVAVTTDYADAVLAGRAAHRWQRKEL